MANKDKDFLDELEDWSRKQLGQKTEELEQMREQGNWAAQTFTGAWSWADFLTWIFLGVFLGGTAYLGFLISTYLL